jgi:hypothetical protein
MSRLSIPDNVPPVPDPAHVDHWQAVDAAVHVCECRTKADLMTRAGMFASAREMARKQAHYEAQVLAVAYRLCGRPKR